MTNKEFATAWRIIQILFPDADIGTDNDGQVLIYLGIKDWGDENEEDNR